MPAKEEVVTISKKGTTAKVNTENGQLFSTVRKNPKKNKEVEVIWYGGAPNVTVPKGEWSNSAILMAPSIGKTSNFKIVMDGKKLSFPPHGLSRYLPWEAVEKEPSKVVLEQIYKEGMKVTAKVGEKEMQVSFPRSFKLTASYEIGEEGELLFQMELKNLSKKPLKYSIGWHPAFKVVEGAVFRVFHKGHYKGSFTLDDFAKAKDRVIDVGASDTIEYLNPEFTLTMSHNLGRSQMWRSEGGRLVAIESITAPSLSRLPESEQKKEFGSQPFYKRLERGEKAIFKVSLRVST